MSDAPIDVFGEEEKVTPPEIKALLIQLGEIERALEAVIERETDGEYSIEDLTENPNERFIGALSQQQFFQIELAIRRAFLDIQNLLKTDQSEEIKRHILRYLEWYQRAHTNFITQNMQGHTIQALEVVLPGLQQERPRAA